MTLSDPAVKRAIEEGWVSTWHNQCPGLYCDNTADSRKPIPYPPEQLATVKEGAGGGNIRIYFCDSEGRIVHRATGFLNGEQFFAEEDFARRQLDRADADRDRERLFRASWEEDPDMFGGLHSFVDPGTRASRAKNLRTVPAGKEVWLLLRQIEDDVYLKGSIG